MLVASTRQFLRKILSELAVLSILLLFADIFLLLYQKRKQEDKKHIHNAKTNSAFLFYFVPPQFLWCVIQRQ